MNNYDISLNLCKINVSSVLLYNHDFLPCRNAINLMDKDIDTCPLKETIVLIEKIIKMGLQGKTPAKNNLVGKCCHVLGFNPFFLSSPSN